MSGNFSRFATSLLLLAVISACGDDSAEPPDDTTTDDTSTGHSDTTTDDSGITVPVDPSPESSKKTGNVSSDATGMALSTITVETQSVGGGSSATVVIPAGTQMKDSSGMSVVGALTVELTSYNSNKTQGIAKYLSQRAGIGSREISQAEVDFDSFEYPIGAIELYIRQGDTVVTQLTPGADLGSLKYCSPAFAPFAKFGLFQQSITSGKYKRVGEFAKSSSNCFSVSLPTLLQSRLNVPAGFVVVGYPTTGAG